MRKIIPYLVFVFVFLYITNNVFAISTPPEAMEIMTNPATKITGRSAILNGNINNIENTGYTGTAVGPYFYFEYRVLGSDKWSTTEKQYLNSNPSSKYNAIIKNLNKNSVYEYRFARELGTTLNSNLDKIYGYTRMFYVSSNGGGHMINGMDPLDKQLNCKNNFEAMWKSYSLGVKNNGQVYILQKSLKDKGYLIGSLDGSFGKKTQDAIKKYQKDNNMKIDGKYNPDNFKTSLEKCPV